MRKLFIQGRRCALAVVLFAAQASAQSYKQEAFKEVPEHLRAQLAARLKSYLEFERAGQYAELYDLLYDQDQSKAEFVKAREQADRKGVGIRLLDFTPTEAVKIEEEVEGPGGVGVAVVDTFQIFGKAQGLRPGTRAEDGRIFISARWQNCNWYFSLPGVMTVN